MRQGPEGTKEGIKFDKSPSARRHEMAWLGPLFLGASLAFLILNLFSVQEDFWDGVIFRYGVEVGDLRGWERNLDESGWELARPLMLSLANLASLLSLEYFAVYKVLVSLILSVLAFELFRFLNFALSLPRCWALLGSALALSSSAWTAAVGTAMVWHVLAIPLVLAAVRLIYKSHHLKYLIPGVLLLVGSFTVNSIAFLATAIALAYEKEWESKSFRLQALSRWRLILVFTLSTLYLVFQLLANPKFGRYEGYNSPFGTDLSGLLSATEAFFWFSLFSLPYLVVITASFFLSRSEGSVRARLRRISGDRAVSISVLLVFLSIFPYVLVGKAPIIYEVWDWQGRHGFTASIFLSALTVSVLAALTSLFETGQRAVFQLLTIGLLLASASLQMLGFQFKLDRNQYDDQLVVLLSSELPNVPPGYVTFEFFGTPLPSHVGDYSYDLQYLLYRSSGTAQWLTSSNPDSHLFPTEERFLNEVDRLRDIYSGTSLSCTSTLRVLGSGWGMPFGPLYRFLTDKGSPYLDLETVEVSCAEPK